jgi:two-component system sensor histidine kinase/response regulator
MEEKMDDTNHNNSALILIVEDNQDYLNYLARILVENHYEIAVARDKKEALAYLDTPYIDRIDLILLDISLSSEGDTEGFEVCKEFRKFEKAKLIPIIFLSQHDDENYILKAFDEGGVDYILKRGGAKNERELLARVKAHIDNRSRDIIKQQNKELKELNATKDRFFKIIAHDLKNPFNSIKGDSEFLDSMYKTLREDQRIDLIKNISRSSQRLYKLLENLLEWAKVQLKEMKPQKCRFDLDPIIMENIALYEENAKKKMLAIHSGVSSPCNVFADSHMIDFIIRNLLNNAVKFNGANGKIDIMSLDKGKFVEISVLDTGVGIPCERIDNLFRIDQSFSTPDTDGEKGTGLGLILCKEFLAVNDGEIHVKSEIGKGSTFTIKLRKNPVEENTLFSPGPKE